MTHLDNAGGDSPDMSGDGESLIQQNDGVLRKGPWTKEEDEILIKFVKEKGLVKWTSIGKQTGLARSGKSCRLRWLNHLRPNLKKGSFTKEEENLIVRLHSEYGNKWTRIASKLPGRTDNEIKNFWNTRVKKCQKRQLPLYPEAIEGNHSHVIANYEYDPRFFINNLDKKFTTKTDSDQLVQSSSSAPSETCVSSLHRLSSVSPHSWSLQRLPSPMYPLPRQSCHSPSFESASKQHPLSQPPSKRHRFLSENQSISTHQPIQIYPQCTSLPGYSSPGYLSSLQQSKPPYQTMQALLSSPVMPPPTWLSSLPEDNGSLSTQQSSVSHSTHPLINTSMCASTPHRYSVMSSLNNKQFSRFKRPGGRLPRPLSAPLIYSTLASKKPFCSTLELNSSNYLSSTTPLEMNSTTQTSSSPTYQLNLPTVGLSDSSLQGSPLSGDMSWPSISRSMNEPISPSSSFVSKMEHPSIQMFSSTALKFPSDTSLRQLNTQSMASFSLLGAKLQEELATGGWQSSKKDDFLSQNLTRESLLTECMKTRHTFKTTDSSDSSLNMENASYKRRRKEFTNISRENNSLHTQVTKEVDILNKTLQPTFLQDGSSRNDNTISENLEGVLVEENSKREVNKSTLTEGSKNYDLLVEDTRVKDMLDTGSTEALSSKQYDFTKCLKMEDSLLVENLNVGGEIEEELREDLLEEGSSGEGLLIESSSKDETVISENSCKGDQLIKIMEQHDVMDASMSKDIHTPKVNSDKEFLLISSEKYPVADEVDLFSSQRHTSFLPDSGGQDVNSSFIKSSADLAEAEDHIDTEILSLLEYLPTTAEIPIWYNTSQEISSNAKQIFD